MKIVFDKPVIGFAAWSGTGKTTLLVQVLPLLKQHGLRVAMIKHAHHAFDIDQPGKDSFELRKAGASPMVISSSRRIAIMIDKPNDSEPDLQDLLNRISGDEVDLVLVEGFKQWAFPKIELFRREVGKSLLYPDDDHIIAIAHDGNLLTQPPIPQLDINQPQQIAEFILEHIKCQP
ncbi:MAG: molybdopterin-guanine dinucleotide biosynthesis protein B [Gammaproteobacteria bacterium]|jgi:molybdopterin-guanine dinucleotide biosynthesis adapter protein|nr:molybdopterin-guanine dinucleotide biosynthesis protein B [Gammaproteobacteria bacterium]